MLYIAILFAAVLLPACGSGQRVSEGIGDSKRHWYGEFYNLNEYARCVEKTNDRRNTQCEHLRLVRVEEPAFWPYPDVPRPKLPEAPTTPVYREGMTSKEYFDALCKAEAGEFIYRSVEGVEGIYQIRPRKPASWDALMDRYVMEDPYGYTNWEAFRPQTIFVHPTLYSFFEAPVMNEGSKRQARNSVVRFSGRHIKQGRYEIEEKLSEPKSQYGFYWRGIKRPSDRELAIAGGELVVIDLRSGEILAVRRGFARSGFVKNSRSGIQWESAEVCPRLRLQSDGFDKAGEFTSWFLIKVLKPRRTRE